MTKAFSTHANKAVDHDGFHMTFGNGFTISVMFGKRNYCDSGETTAEVAVWDNNGDWYIFNEDDNHNSLIKVPEDSDVIGYCTSDQVAFIMELARKFK
jgi:hypothetical protein